MKNVLFTVVNTPASANALKRKVFFRDVNAFMNCPDKPCYAPGMGGKIYTHEDFLAIFNGQEEFAKACFNELDGQTPEDWYSDAIYDEALAMCPHCGKLYWMNYEIEACPDCGSLPEYEDGISDSKMEYLDEIVLISAG